MRISTLLLALLLFAPAALAQGPATATVIQGDITTNRTLTNDQQYRLVGFVRVMEGATLTIQPGTIIYGDEDSDGTLIVMRGARINAEGTPDRPIVFTSQRPIGERQPGDWGGIILLGRASINTATGTLNVEGVPPSVGAIGGGGANPDDNDNSGVMRYVRIEFGGEELSPNNEINGLTMAGVGRGTTIEYVQVSYNDDDAFEWFGGTVNGRYLISLGAVDDDFDTDLGWRGNVQYGLVVRDPALADAASGGRSNAFETDNAPNDATGATATPRSAGNFSNVTVIGPIGQAATIAQPYQSGILLRTGTNTSVYNSIVMGFPEGLRINGQPAVDQANAGNLQVRNTLVTGNFASNVSGYSAENFFRTAGFGNQTAASPQAVGLVNPFLHALADRRQFDPRPASGSVAAQMQPSFNNTRLPEAVPGGVPGLFARTSFVGAFAPDGTRWDLPWANYDPQNVDYAAGSTSNEDVAVNGGLKLSQNKPNPFTNATMIEFTLAEAQHIRLAVYDLLGREIEVLHDGLHTAGNGYFRFEAASLPAGTYLVRLQNAEGSQVQRITVAR
ncbi:MAG: T9SS type A sorting domain-containing protein [Rubricoccaceae bacterium]